MIASKPGGFDVAADILNRRLHQEKTQRQEHTAEGRCQEFCVNGFRLVDGFRLHWLHLGGG
jgi:hypothetical protein